RPSTLRIREADPYTYSAKRYTYYEYGSAPPFHSQSGSVHVLSEAVHVPVHGLHPAAMKLDHAVYVYVYEYGAEGREPAAAAGALQFKRVGDGLSASTSSQRSG